MRYLLYLYLFFYSINLEAQVYADEKFYLIDSLDLEEVPQDEKELLDEKLSLYHETKNDVKKISYLSEYVEFSGLEDLWIPYNDLIISKCEFLLKQKHTNSDKKKILLVYADALNDFGYIKNHDGQKNTALFYYYKSLGIYNKIDYKEGIAASYNNIGLAYDSKGNYLQALKFYFKSLSVSEKYKNFEIMAISYSNIGVIYDQQKEYDKALEFYMKALKIQLKIKDKSGIATSYNNLGFLFNRKKEKKKAIYYYTLSNKIYFEINDYDGITASLANIGSIYLNENNLTKALFYFEKALVYDVKYNNKNAEAFTLTNIGNIYNSKKEFETAKKYYLKSINIAKKIDAPDVVKNTALLLSEIYFKEKDWQNAYLMQNMYIKTRDSLNNASNQKEMITLGVKYDFEKQKALDKKENEKKLAISKEKAKKQSLVFYFTLGILIVVCSFLILIFNRFKVTQKQKLIIEQQKHLVEEKNKEITDSITYAKRIQSAILPQSKFVEEYFPNSFILYKPKDIVAGDFYWFEVIDDLIFFAAADCTGHGVPGAMVSVVCHNALNRSVKEFNLKKPSNILDKTREIVISEFEKSKEDVKDGMDISLCAIDLKSKLMNWSGAHNPLWILRNQDVIEFKADKQPIGKFAYAKQFTNHEIQLFENDEIYISTDGFQDQFGGEKGKKFKASQLKTILILNSHKTMEEKLNLLDQTFENWKGELEQVDDVCIIGARV